MKTWDLSTRLFHWLLVVLLISAYLTRNYSNDPSLYLHRLNGYAILTLLIFRVIWGFVGSPTSRFAAFLPNPFAALRYARALLARQRPHHLGHNPLGSLLIYALLLAVAAQAATGLFTTDDTLAQGPLNRLVSDATAARAGAYHALGFWIIAGLAAVHVVANVIYQCGLKEPLITAMVTGRKPAGDYLGAKPEPFASNLRALVCLLVAALLVGGGVMASGDSLLR